MLTPDLAVDLVSESLTLVMHIVVLIVLPALVVGLLVGIFQAATQINEQTLSFLPRLLVTLLAVILGGGWMAAQLMDFCVEMFRRAAELVG